MQGNTRPVIFISPSPPSPHLSNDVPHEVLDEDEAEDLPRPKAVCLFDHYAVHLHWECHGMSSHVMNGSIPSSHICCHDVIDGYDDAACSLS